MKQYLAWIWLACGLGLLLMGLSSSWDDALFKRPHDGKLHSYTGVLQRVTYDAPAKSPTLVEVVVYHKRDGLQHGYLRYGLHAWEERLKPYLNQEVTILMGAHHQVWSVDVAGEAILNPSQIERRLQGMKKAQQEVAKEIVYVGSAMVLLWAFLFRKRRAVTKDVYS